MLKYIIVFIYFLLVAIGLIYSIRLMRKDAENIDHDFEIATEWFDSLSDVQKAHIMQLHWHHPGTTLSKKYLVSIYKYFNETKQDKNYE